MSTDLTVDSLTIEYKPVVGSGFYSVTATNSTPFATIAPNASIEFSNGGAYLLIYIGVLNTGNVSKIYIAAAQRGNNVTKTLVNDTAVTFLCVKTETHPKYNVIDVILKFNDFEITFNQNVYNDTSGTARNISSLVSDSAPGVWDAASQAFQMTKVIGWTEDYEN